MASANINPFGNGGQAAEGLPISVGNDANADFSIVDDNDNSIFSIINGHIFTSGFNSNALPSLYQQKLVSGTNIKTINGQSLLGSEDITISTSKRTSLNVLFMGNSYSLDTAAYVPKILRAINPNLDVVVGVLYSPSLTISDQLSNLTNNTPYTDVYISKSDGTWGKTSSTDDKTPNTMFSTKDWDIVVLHQRSITSGDFRTVEPYMGDLISLIKTKAQDAKIGWLLTPSLRTQSITYYNGTANDKVYNSTGTQLTTSDEMYSAIANVAKYVSAYYGIDFIIPTGTAIQMLRNSSYGEPTETYNHLPPGIPVLTAGYCMAVTILKELEYNNPSVWGCSYTPVSGEDPSPNGSFEPSKVTTANIRLAQKCAMLAIYEKFTTSTIL